MPRRGQAQKVSVVVNTQIVAPLPLKTQAKLRSNESDPTVATVDATGKVTVRLKISHENRLLTVSSMDTIKIFHTLGLIVKVKRSGILLIKELDLLINKVQEYTLRHVKRIYCIQAEACAEEEYRNVVHM